MNKLGGGDGAKKTKIADGICARARVPGEPLIIAPKRKNTKGRKIVGMTLWASSMAKFTYQGAKKEAVAAALLYGWRQIVLLEIRLVANKGDLSEEQNSSPPRLLGRYVVHGTHNLQVHLDSDMHMQLAQDMGLSMAKKYPLLFEYAVRELERKKIVIVVDDD